MELVNRTPFAAERLLSVDRTGSEVLVVVVKSTFEVGDEGVLTLAEAQSPVMLADSFLGEPGLSSIRDASDLHPEKPGCDLILRGEVRPPRPALAVKVSFRVGEMKRVARVFGPRVWMKRLGFSRISDPTPFESIPLIWENAFGGRDTSHSDPARHECEARNPVGRGFRARKSKAEVLDSPLPSIEDPSDLITSPKDRPKPMGFGFVGRDWAPRVGFAGTYDDAWQKSRMPLLPDDFDNRYYDCAPTGLVAARAPQAGTPVEVRGMRPDRDVKFHLPAVAPRADVLMKASRHPLEFRLNTVLVDTDTLNLVMTHSAHLRIHGQVDNVAAVLVNGDWT